LSSDNQFSEKYIEAILFRFRIFRLTTC